MSTGTDEFGTPYDQTEFPTKTPDPKPAAGETTNDTTCVTCGKPKFGPWSTIAAGAVKDIQGYYCMCVQAFVGTVAAPSPASTYSCPRCGADKSTHICLAGTSASSPRKGICKTVTHPGLHERDEYCTGWAEKPEGERPRKDESMPITSAQLKLFRKAMARTMDELLDKWHSGQPIAPEAAGGKKDCKGYPDCDGDLSGEPHEVDCPAAPAAPSGEQSLEIKAHQWLNDYYKREWQTDILNFGDDHCIGEDVATLCQFMAKFANAELTTLRRERPMPYEELMDSYQSLQEAVAHLGPACAALLKRAETAEAQLRELTEHLAEERAFRITSEKKCVELRSTIETLQQDLRVIRDIERAGFKRQNELQQNVERLTEKNQHDTRTILDQVKTIERLEGELRRFTALEAHLPPGYAVGDDATAELAVKLAEVERQLAELRSGQK